MSKNWEISVPGLQIVAIGSEGVAGFMSAR